MGDMDSGISGSLQSSSTGGGCGGGDDQEYESRANSFSAFINNAPPLQLYSLNNNGSFDHHNPHQVSNYFDPPNFIVTTHNDNNNHNNNNNNSNINNGSNYHLHMAGWGPDANLSTAQPSPPPPLPLQGGGAVAENSSQPSDLHHHQKEMKTSHGLSCRPSRNPKKRSRASRRAPTTVLTTDTTNFRQMVQEFTGIPAPPFTAASSAFPSRTRFDLFGGGGGVGGPPYLMRPFPQKILPHPLPLQQPFLSSFEFGLGPGPGQKTSTLENGCGPGPGPRPEDTPTVNGGIISSTATTTTAADSQAAAIVRGEGMLDSWICSSD